MLEEYINNPSLRFLITTYCQIAMIILTIIAGFFARKSLAKFLKKSFSDSVTLSLFFAVLVFAFALRIYYFGGSHENIFDEFLYMRHARDILDTGQIQIPIRSALWPVMLAWVFGIFWVSSSVGMGFSLCISVLGIALCMFMVKALSKSSVAMLTSGIFLSLMPYHIFWSTRIETNIISLSFLFWLLALSLYLIPHPKKFKLSVFFIFFWLLFSSLRGENMILAYLIIFGTFILTPRYHCAHPVKTLCKIWLILLGAAILSSNYINQIEYTSSQDWGYGNKHSLWDNAKFLAQGVWAQGISWWFYILASVWILWSGIRLFSKKFPWRGAVIIVWSFSFLGLVYSRIWLPELWGVTRAYLMFVPVIVILAAIWLQYVYHFLSRTRLFKNCFIMIVSLVIVWLTVHQLILKYNYRSSDFKFVQTKFSNDFLRNAFDSNCHYVIFSDSPYSAFTDLKFSYLWQFADSQEYRDEIFANNSCVMLVRDKFCVEESRWETYRSPKGVRAKKHCERILREHESKEIINIWTKDFRYRIYEIFEKNS